MSTIFIVTAEDANEHQSAGDCISRAFGTKEAAERWVESQTPADWTEHEITETTLD